ncbi:hypothetical protein D1007_18774 [Hordeum vulgare]|nr:hypothetical protein D1007_18774 [Hordeum vulgare]
MPHGSPLHGLAAPVLPWVFPPAFAVRHAPPVLDLDWLLETPPPLPSGGRDPWEVSCVPETPPELLRAVPRPGTAGHAGVFNAAVVGQDRRNNSMNWAERVRAGGARAAHSSQATAAGLDVADNWATVVSRRPRRTPLPAAPFKPRRPIPEPPRKDLHQQTYSAPPPGRLQGAAHHGAYEACCCWTAGASGCSYQPPSPSPSHGMEWRPLAAAGRAVPVIHATLAMHQEATLLGSNAAVAWLDGDLKASTQDIAPAIVAEMGMLADDVCVIKHFCGAYLVCFFHQHHCVGAVGRGDIPFRDTGLQLRPCRLEAHSKQVDLVHHVRLCLDGLPLQA